MKRRAFLSQTTLGTSALAWGFPLSAAPGSLSSLFSDHSADDEIVKAAAKRIPEIRTRKIQIQLLDLTGSPIPDFPIEVHQKKHQFWYGDVCIGLDRMYRHNEADTTRGRYWKKRYTEVANSVNVTCYWTERQKHDLIKTEEFQGDLQLDAFNYCVDWALSQGLRVKGHPLFWPVAKAIPRWLRRYDYSTQMKFVETRVRSMVANFKGRISAWDVVNEAMWEPALKNLPIRNWPHIEALGDMLEYILPIFRWCREEDPSATLLINDYGLSALGPKGAPISQDGTTCSLSFQRRRYLELAQAMGDRGLAPDALGLQCHPNTWMSMQDLVHFFDEMSGLKIPLHITEFGAYPKALEAEIPKEEVEARYAAYVDNYLTCAFGHPGVEAFFFFGDLTRSFNFSDRGEHEPTPLYQLFRDFWEKRYATHETLRTNGKGMVELNAYLGDYELLYPTHDTDKNPLKGLRFSVNPYAHSPFTFVLAR